MIWPNSPSKKKTAPNSQKRINRSLPLFYFSKSENPQIENQPQIPFLSSASPFFPSNSTPPIPCRRLHSGYLSSAATVSHSPLHSSTSPIWNDAQLPTFSSPSSAATSPPAIPSPSLSLATSVARQFHYSASAAFSLRLTGFETTSDAGSHHSLTVTVSRRVPLVLFPFSRRHCPATTAAPRQFCVAVSCLRHFGVADVYTRHLSVLHSGFSRRRFRSLTHHRFSLLLSTTAAFVVFGVLRQPRFQPPLLFRESPQRRILAPP